MVMVKTLGVTSRNLLPYFIESMVWKKHTAAVVDNPVHWMSEDPVRATKMFAAKINGRKGYTVQDYLYDMIECVYSAKLSLATKRRLYIEIDEVERIHELANTIKDEL